MRYDIKPGSYHFTLSPSCRMPSFDELLHHVGDFGRYQQRISLLGCLPLVPFAFVLVGVVFLGHAPEHWCRIDHAKHIQRDCGWSDGDLRMRAAPLGSVGRCQRFDVDWNTSAAAICSNFTQLFTNTTGITPGLKSCDHEWVYGSNHTTVVTEVIHKKK